MQLLIKINLLVFLLVCFNAQAQECGTPDIQPQEAMNYPWFGNPDYLPSFMDSVRNVEGIPSQYARIIPDIKWRIPIRFWILTEGF
jgi:hypothetical protein